MPTPSTPSIADLKRALQIAEQIQTLESELSTILGGRAAAPEPSARLTAPQISKPGRKKRKVSAESRAKMAAAQRARWAKKNAK
jgi:hypothetical protein